MGTTPENDFFSHEGQLYIKLNDGATPVYPEDNDNTYIPPTNTSEIYVNEDSVTSQQLEFAAQSINEGDYTYFNNTLYQKQGGAGGKRYSSCAGIETVVEHL